MLLERLRVARVSREVRADNDLFRAWGKIARQLSLGEAWTHHTPTQRSSGTHRKVPSHMHHLHHRLTCSLSHQQASERTGQRIPGPPPVRAVCECLSNGRPVDLDLR